MGRASRDGWFGERTRCQSSLRHRWPTVEGDVPAPDAACSSSPVAISELAGVMPSPLEDRETVSVGPRGACAIVDGHVRCVGAIPTPTVSSPFTSIAVSAGTHANACGISDGRVVCWGDGYSPNAGNPSAVVDVELIPRQLPEAAVVDSPPLPGTAWPPGSAIERECQYPARSIPRCAGGTEGKPWATVLADANDLLGKTVSVRDRLSVGPLENNNAYWAACELAYADARMRALQCNLERRPTILGDGLAPLVLTDSTWGCLGEDPSRLCCALPAFGQVVVATGILRRGSAWHLDNPSLCT